MAVIPLPSKPDYSLSIATYLSLFSSGTFQLTYATWHTSQFLSQAKSTAMDGFLEGQLGPDPEYGTCLQCAAIDRARLKTNPVTPRSDICSRCFKKYCYDPASPPPEGQIVGRRFKFKDPDPFGIKSFYLAHKTGVILAGVIVALGLIATITGCTMFWWRRFQRRRTRAVVYQRLSRGDGAEWSAHMRHTSYDMSPPRYSVLGYEKGQWQNSEPGSAMEKTHYAEPSYQSERTYVAEPGYETAKLHSPGPGYETEKLHSPEPVYETATMHHAGPSYEPATTQLHSLEPVYETATMHHAGPSYEPATTQYTAPNYPPERRD